MGFELDSDARRRLGYRLIDCIDDYFSSLPQRSVQLPLEKRTFGQLTNQMPEFGSDAAAVFDDVCRELVDQGFHVPAANYFGLMNPTPAYMAVLAEALVAALNPQLATLARSQLASKIEIETVRWIAERIWQSSDGIPAHAGTFTSGGAEANFSALAIALAAHFPQSIEDGVSVIGARPVLYASAESHHSVDKAAGLLGIGRNAVRRIGVDTRLHIDLAELDAAITSDLRAGRRPFCAVATAGTTNSGAVDDLVALADLCRERKLWLHVDGAYGAAAVFPDLHRDLMRGIERADSITMDPHKWLAMPYAAGVVITRHPESPRQAFEVATPYMPRDTSARLLDNFKISTQWSRRMNSLKLWLTLRVHGRVAYQELIGRQLRLARDFAGWIRQSEHFELLLEPELTIVNFRVKGAGTEEQTAAANAAVVEAVTRDGSRWISTTNASGRSVIRMMVISYLTDERNVRELQHALLAAVPAAARGIPR
jgi:glutamate/tyrosine decarboxylase-like PLP-dependent enzyme